MAGVRDARPVVGVEVTGADAALELIDELRRFHAEIAPTDDGGCEVEIELGAGAERTVLDVLAAIDRWAERHPGRQARLRVGARSYRWPTTR